MKSIISTLIVLIISTVLSTAVFADNFATGEKIGFQPEKGDVVTQEAVVKVVTGSPLVLAKKARQLCSFTGVIVGDVCVTGIFVLYSRDNGIVYADYTDTFDLSAGSMCAHAFGMDGINIMSGNCDDKDGSLGVCSCFWKEILDKGKP